MKIRLIGTIAEVQLAVYRLREAFSKVTATEPIASRNEPGQYRIYCVCSF